METKRVPAQLLFFVLIFLLCLPLGNPQTIKTSCGKGLAACPGITPLKCILSDWMCNGYKECPRGVDESPAFCNKYNCTATKRVMCPPSNGKPANMCTTADALCDGNIDCPNGSDEDQNYCSKVFKCSTYGKIPCPSGFGCMSSTSKICDGARDCADNSDENSTICRTFNCSSSPSKFLKNFIKTYPDRRVHTYRVKCPAGGTKCVDSDNLICDGIRDCPKGTDEDRAYCATFNCASANKVSCPGRVGQCIWGDQLCDGVIDCRNGTDETRAFCSTYTCPAKTVKCSSTNTCVSGYMCDGRQDCPDGSDENATTCTNFKCPALWEKCLDGRQCILSSTKCNGVANCKDASDERALICKK